MCACACVPACVCVRDIPFECDKLRFHNCVFAVRSKFIVKPLWFIQMSKSVWTLGFLSHEVCGHFSSRWVNGLVYLLFFTIDVNVLCYPSLYSTERDYSLYRAPVLPKQSPGILGTILDGSPLRRRILEWLNNPSKLLLILPTSEGWQAVSTPPGIDSMAEQDLNSGPEDTKPTTLTIKPTPGIGVTAVSLTSQCGLVSKTFICSN